MEKFILTENIKHILTEKYLLNERYILNEAFTVADLDNLKTEFIKIAKSLKPSDENKTNTKTTTALKSEIDVLKDLLGSEKEGGLKGLIKHGLSGEQKDPTIVQGRCRQAISKLEAILQTADPSFTKDNPNFRKVLNDFNAIIQSSDFDKKMVVQAKSKLNMLSQAIDVIANETGESNSDTEVDREVIEDAATKINELKQYINDNKGVVPDDANIEKAIIAAKKACTGFDIKKAATVSAIGDAAGELIQKVDALFKSKGFTAAATAGDDSTDWTARFKNTTDKTLFWTEYFKTAWGKYAQRVADLGKPFRDECETLGFAETTNPFISFLKEYLVNKNFPIDATHYALIHNMAAEASRRNYINFKQKTNILNPEFCKDFYNQTANDGKKYIDLYINRKSKLESLINSIQSDAQRQEFLDSIQDDSAKEKVSHLITYFSESPDLDKVWFVIIYNASGIEFNNIISSDGTAPALPQQAGGIADLKLKPHNEIDTLFNLLGQDTSNIASKSFTQTTLVALLDVIKKDCGPDVKKVFGWINVLVGMFFPTPASAESVLKPFPKLLATTVAISIKEQLRIKEKVIQLGNSMTANDLKQVIGSLNMEADYKDAFK